METTKINMNTKRSSINELRKMLQEVGADSNYTNQFLYGILSKQAKWLIKREISAGRIFRNTTFFQTLGCQDVIEVSTIDACCPVKTNCKIYRTKNKLPNIWADDYGPVIKSVLSVDGTTEFFITTPMGWQNKRNDPYQKKTSEKYTFFTDGYWWFPEHNPHRINLYGFFVDDISQLSNCSEKKECIRFLDTEFFIPPWVEAEMLSKALQSLLPSKQMQEDEDINKNTIRK